MKEIKRLAIAMLCLILLTGCRKEILNANEYIKHVSNPDNSLNKSKELGDILVELQYKPIPFVIASELRKNNISEEEYNQRYEELKGGQYYNMKLSVRENKSDITRYKVNNPNEYQQRIHYLSFALKNDIKLIDGRDTLRPKLFHFERAYDVSKHRTFVISFDATENMEDKTFILESPIFATGPMKIKFNKEDINNTPNIKLKK